MNVQKLVLGAVLVAALVGLSGCAGNDGRDAPSTQQGVAEVLQQQTEAQDAQGQTTGQESSGTQQQSDTPKKEFVGDAAPAYEQVDIDLTSMNADMVYATVYDMMADPAAYEGKTVRMTGPYYYTYYEPTAAIYYYVLIKDAMACCSQGLEFVWGDGSHALDEYPENGTEVVVTGTFKPYREGETLYVHLVGASLEAA